MIKINKFWILTIFLLLVLTSFVSAIEDSQLIFEDNFNDNSINTSKWIESDPCNNIQETNEYLRLIRTSGCTATGTLKGLINSSTISMNNNYAITGEVYVANQYSSVGGYRAIFYSNYKDS